MIVFVPGSRVEDLTVALYGLMRPVPLGHEVTGAMFPCVTALDGSRWLKVDTQYRVFIHPEATIGRIADILQPFIEAEELPPETNENLSAFILSHRGQSIEVYQAFPTLFKALAKERKQMIEEGLLPKPGGML